MLIHLLFYLFWRDVFHANSVIIWFGVIERKEKKSAIIFLKREWAKCWEYMSEA